MKKILFITILLIAFGCSKSEEQENLNPHNLQNLGLSASNNIYPFYPDTTNVGLMDNRWYDWKNGDTLTVYRRDLVTDDSGDNIYYTFLVKNNEWIVPLRTKRTSSDAYADPPKLNQLMYDLPITNIKIQKYEEGYILACEISTGQLTDRMWIILND
jgi:hypothetical protein